MADPISNAASSAASAGAAPGANGGSSGAALSTDFDTFLSLLTAQLKNQDPLQPLDSTQFVAQLASFSAVEQQTATNAKLDEIMGLLSSGDSAAALSWLDAEVAVKGDALHFHGAPVAIALDPKSADAAQLVEIHIDSKSGGRVATLIAAPGDATAIWSGAGDSGQAVPAGAYTVSAIAIRDGEKIGEVEARAFAPISDVRLGDQGLLLTLKDGRQIAASGVVALRSAR